MRSTFHGLELGKRGLFAQQSALNTTGHNISNANTEGYSRQRVNMVATPGIPYVGLNMSREAGLLGTGVMVSDVQRMREGFLDIQYRNEVKSQGYWDERVDVLQKIEAIYQEPSETGLQKVMDQMWQAWQDLSKDPINPSARAVVRERSIAVAETFSSLYKQLQEVHSDMDKMVGTKAFELNSLASQIASVNKMINDVVPHGYVPNDLYDQRDVLIDKLSKMLPVTVTNGDNGMVNIQVDGRDLVTGSTASPVAAVRNPVTGVNDLTISGAQYIPTSGAMAAMLEGRDVLVPSSMKRFDLLAINLTKEINDVHQSGLSISDIKNGTAQQIPFFVDGTKGAPNYPSGATNIKINPAIINSLDAIAAAKPEGGVGNTGNNENALAMAAIKFKVINAGVGPNDFKEATTLDDYYRYTVGETGVMGQEAIRNQKNAEKLVGMVEGQRESIKGVSIDEEMSNLVKYQHAYSAAARSITSVDEILDKIINGMGRVGL
ncbi:flagellar hook-associated protein FlgK [Brevibacillus fortis]|uniref:flagellar hook-associated protein FlgK n=1 Tax=Brevibacillus fortis TaxID=2126352 RepID=UPI002E23C4C3|nr:flagellar hook-associated protein FlgK [Brevibacillus fortis]